MLVKMLNQYCTNYLRYYFFQIYVQLYQYAFSSLRAILISAERSFSLISRENY